MSLIQCHHCLKNFDFPRAVSNDKKYIIWCGRCVSDHHFLFKQFKVADYPYCPSSNPEHWELEINIKALETIPKYDNIIP